MEDIESLEPFEAAVDIARDITEGVPDVEAGTAGIGEHIKHIALGTGGFVAYPIGTCSLPMLLPFPFDIPELIFHKKNEMMIA
jgi:hypothetical protein